MSTMLDRYEVGRHDLGRVESFKDKGSAGSCALRKGLGFTVFDRMARKGAWDLWRVQRRTVPGFDGTEVELIAIRRRQA